MVQVYLLKDGDLWKVYDYAIAIIRLSYQYEIDTQNKEKIFQKIVNENGNALLGGDFYDDQHRFIL